MKEEIEDFLFQDFQNLLCEAMRSNVGYSNRDGELKELVQEATWKGSAKSYEALGEYLFLIAYDQAREELKREVG
jgi:hypothetical protein